MTEIDSSYLIGRLLNLLVMRLRISKRTDGGQMEEDRWRDVVEN
jgi:hypothetical protein